MGCRGSKIGKWFPGKKCPAVGPNDGSGGPEVGGCSGVIGAAAGGAEPKDGSAMAVDQG